MLHAAGYSKPFTLMAFLFCFIFRNHIPSIRGWGERYSFQKTESNFSLASFLNIWHQPFFFLLHFLFFLFFVLETCTRWETPYIGGIYRSRALQQVKKRRKNGASQGPQQCSPNAVWKRDLSPCLWRPLLGFQKQTLILGPATEVCKHFCQLEGREFTKNLGV